MKELKEQLKSMAESLATLAEQVETVATYIEKFELEAAAPAEAPKVAPAKAKAAPKKAAPKKAPRGRAAKAAKAKVEEAPKAAAEKPAAEKPSSVLGTVYDVIKRSRKGANIAKIKEKTGLESRQISNALYKLTKKGQIKSMARGVYAKA